MSKTVFITGATSGIGAACARLFARQGCRLLLAARREQRLRELAEDLCWQNGSEVHYVVLDVRDPVAVRETLGQLPAAWKKIDVLINNAGLSLGLDPVQKGNPEDWDVMIDTNIKGLLYVTREVGQWMAEDGSGHIVNIGSIAAKEVYPNGNVYCATKHAVDALNKGMRIDLLPYGVKVTAVHPGPAETEFAMVRFRGDAARAKKVYEGYQPLMAEDIAEAIEFAVSRPAHVNIDDLLIMPAAQATATMINRKV